MDTGSSSTTLLNSNLTSFGTTATSITFGLDVTGTSLQGASSIGLHWGMTCGNDTIEGAYDVPEPASIIMILLGLVCLFSFTQRRRLTATSNVS
ncbi:MAG: PEP-CTERM sorting domain-containing protein [Gammaproteobacteria bacterium]|nr:PEP-CTERM sorting domain-containing protein [Gammaproteobacteria bacterium]